MGKKKKNKPGHLAFFVIIFIAFAIIQYHPPLLLPWSSWTMTDYAFSTGSHQSICRVAFDLLRNHPSFTNDVKFPSLEDILNHSGVDADITGLGPDNYHNVPYSKHVYNPALGAGKAPEAVFDHFDNLKRELTGKDAAYLAHFIQDLSVPYHVLGMPESDIPPNARELIDRKIEDRRVTGPNIPGPEYALLFSRYDEDHNLYEANADWFDPWYYDGPFGVYTVKSSHFTYEKDVLGRSVPDPPPGYSPEWNRSENVQDFARLVAKRTREIVDSGRDVFNPQSDTTGNLLSFAARDTFTLWRASFCALRVNRIELEKIPDQDFTFRLKIGILNTEPRSDALDINAKYELQGSQTGGTGNFKRIGIIPNYNVGDLKSCTGETISSNVIRLNQDFFDNPSGTSGRILITIQGKYEDAPDSGEWKEKIPLSVLGGKMTKLIDLKEIPLESALNYLAPFDIETEECFESPSEYRLEYTVRSQIPDPGTWVGPGDRVKIVYYGEFQEVAVPTVVQKTVDQARKLIERNMPPKYMKPLLRAVTVPEGAKPEEIVIKQAPLAATRVPLGSEVTIYVKNTEDLVDDPLDIIELDIGGEDPQDPNPVDIVELLESDDTDIIQVGNLVISPPAPVMLIGNNSVTVLTAQAFDLEGDEITGEDLDRINFNWYVQDASLAYVAGSGQTAYVSVLDSVTLDVLENPEKVLKVTAVCSTGTALESKVITVQMGDLNEDWEKVSEKKEGPGDEDDWAKTFEKKEKSKIAQQNPKKKYVYRTTGIAGTWTHKFYGTIIRVVKKGNTFSGYVVKNNFTYEHHPYDPWEEVWKLSYAGKDKNGDNRYVGSVMRKWKRWTGEWIYERHQCEFVPVVQPEVDILFVSSETSSNIWTGSSWLRNNNWVPKWLRDLRKKK